jgi:hypothetical protein
MQASTQKTSVSDYLARESTSASRHEYVDGEIYAMSGASRRHNLLATNLLRHAANAAVNRLGCQVFGGAMKVRVEARNSFYYPDVSGTCDVDDRDERFLTRPCTRRPSTYRSRSSPHTYHALSRQFKAQSGCTLHEFRTLVRLKRSAEVRPHGERVATRCGFDDPYYFSRAFRSHFGVALTSYQIELHERLRCDVARHCPGFYGVRVDPAQGLTMDLTVRSKSEVLRVTSARS